MNAVSKFEQVTKTAKTVNNAWSNRDIAQFHYFNPHGLIAAKRVTDDQVSALVDAGLAKSGAIIAYGSLNYFHYDQLAKLINKKAVSWVDLVVTLDGLKRDIASAQEFIASVEG